MIFFAFIGRMCVTWLHHVIYFCIHRSSCTAHCAESPTPPPPEVCIPCINKRLYGVIHFGKIKLHLDHFLSPFILNACCLALVGLPHWREWRARVCVRLCGRSFCSHFQCMAHQIFSQNRFMPFQHFRYANIHRLDEPCMARWNVCRWKAPLASPGGGKMKTGREWMERDSSTEFTCYQLNQFRI